MIYPPYAPLSLEATLDLLTLLKNRFLAHMERHHGIQTPDEWQLLEAKLEANPKALWSLSEMERTGGEPNVVTYNPITYQFTFIDCSIESPPGRGNLVSDHEAEDLLAKESPGETCHGNAIDTARAMGVALLSPAQYENILQKLGRFDEHTSTWLQTPADLRREGYALDGSRYGLNLDISETRVTLHDPKERFRACLVI